MSRTVLPRSARTRLIAVAIAAIAVAAGATAVAEAAPPDGSDSVTSSVSALRAALRSGTLRDSTAVLHLCATAHAACQVQALSAAGATQPLSRNAPVGYGATELATAYGLPAASVGANGTITIIDAGADTSLESDLNTYRSQYGLPACTTKNGCLTIADYHGGAPLTPSQTTRGKREEQTVGVETSLDVDMASAACPACHITELQVPIADAFPRTQDQIDQGTADFGTAVDTAVSLGTNAVSMSYQYPADTFSDTGQPAQDLDQPGVALLASSGDSGLETSSGGWPQDLPTVTSVGGTSLHASGTSYSQTAWSDAGSGCATDLPPATGQPASVSAACAGHRAAADISAVADPSTGVAVYDTYAPSSGKPYNWITVGGTSASAPFVGGIYARAGHLTDVHGPNTLYAAAEGTFTDVTSGRNGRPATCQSLNYAVSVCQSGPGWDGPTGLGTPNGLTGF